MTNKLVAFFEGVKNYQRPVRTVMWAILIAVAFILCLTGRVPCENNQITYTILICMFSDMGLYTAARSIEKSKSFDSKKDNSVISN